MAEETLQQFGFRFVGEGWRAAELCDHAGHWYREATGGKRSICTARSLSFAPAALVWTAFTLDAEALELVGEERPRRR